jgi:TolB protein
MTAMALAAVVLLAACGDGGGEGEDSTPGATVTPAPSPALPAGADVTPLPITPGTGEGPEPEGSIVFLTFRDGNREIYSVKVDGSDPTNLTNDPGVDENPDVSPDGTQIVWASDRDGGDLHLYVMDIDGSNVRQLTSDAGGLSPRWSPDGKKIAFARGGAIMVVDAEAAAPAEPEMVLQGGDPATTEPCEAGGFPGGWSPDGQRITFYAASVSQRVGQVCTVNADGSGLTVVVGDPPVYNVEPTWSRDGRYLAFRSIRGGNHDVYTYDFETETVRRITDHAELDIEPSWSSDGEWIVFGSGRDNDFLDIYIMRKDGSDVRQVTEHPDKDSEPVWVP